MVGAVTVWNDASSYSFTKVGISCQELATDSWLIRSYIVLKMNATIRIAGRKSFNQSPMHQKMVSNHVLLEIQRDHATVFK